MVAEAPRTTPSHIGRGTRLGKEKSTLLPSGRDLPWTPLGHLLRAGRAGHVRQAGV